MSIWGKIVGSVAGLTVGGPIGMLVGAIGGHIVDKMRSDAEPPDPEQQKRSMGFTIAVIVLGAKMAKADGQVTRDEVNAFKQVFKVPEEEMKNVSRVFNMARKDAAGFEPYAQQMAGMFTAAPEVLEELLWCLTYIAKADGVIHPAEREFLRKVSEIFGFDQATFERVTTLQVEGDDADPYVVLGVTKEATDAEIKAAHRALVVEFHPDKLIAKGMPEEFVNAANDRLAKVNAAYDQIQRLRGL